MLNIITLAIVLSSSAAAQDNTITIKAVVPDTTEEMKDKVQQEMAEQVKRRHERMRANAIGPLEFRALGKKCCESNDGIWLGSKIEEYDLACKHGLPGACEKLDLLPNSGDLTCVLPWIPAFSPAPNRWPEDLRKELLPKLDKYAACVGHGYLTYKEYGQGETKYYFYSSLSFFNRVKHGGTSAANLQQTQWTEDFCP